MTSTNEPGSIVPLRPQRRREVLWQAVDGLFIVVVLAALNFLLGRAHSTTLDLWLLAALVAMGIVVSEATRWRRKLLVDGDTLRTESGVRTSRLPVRLDPPSEGAYLVANAWDRWNGRLWLRTAYGRVPIDRRWYDPDDLRRFLYAVATVYGRAPESVP